MNFANSCAVLWSTDPGQVRICLHVCLAQSEPVRQAVMCWSETGLFSSQHDPLTILEIYVVHSDHSRHHPPFFPIPISSLLPTTPFPSFMSLWFCFWVFFLFCFVFFFSWQAEFNQGCLCDHAICSHSLQYREFIREYTPEAMSVASPESISVS